MPATMSLTPQSKLARSSYLAPALVIGASSVFIALMIGYIQRAYINVWYLDGLMMVSAIDEKFYAGTLTISDMFPMWEQHRLSGYAALILLNSFVFNLNALVDPWVYVIVYCALALILYRPYMRFFRSALTGESDVPIAVSYIVVLSVIFSLVHHPYHMMTTQFVSGTVVFAGAAVLFDKIARGATGWRLPIGFSATYGFYLLLSGGYMGGAMLSLTLITLISAMLARRVNLQLGVTYAVAMSLSAVYVLSGPSSGNLSKLLAAIASPIDTLMSVVAGISTSDFSQYVVIEELGDQHWIYALNGGFLALLGALCVWRFFQSKLYRFSYIPLLLMGYTVGVILTIRLGRVDYGWTWPTQMWYHFHMMYYLIGLIWILMFDVIRFRNNLKSILILLFPIVVILATQTYSNIFEWKRAPYLKLWLEQKREATLDPTPESIKVLYWEPKEIMETIDFMKKYKLGVFAK